MSTPSSHASSAVSNPRYERLEVKAEAPPPQQTTTRRTSGKNNDCCDEAGGVLLTLALVGFIVCASIRFLNSYFDFNRDGELQRKANQHHFEVEKMQFTKFNVTSGFGLSAEWELRFNVTNMDGLNRAYSYGRGIVSIYFEGQLLWERASEAFYQKPGNSTTVKLESLDREVVVVPNLFISKEFAANKKLKDSVHFEVKFNGRVRRGQLGYYRDLRILCRTDARFEDDNTLVGVVPSSCMTKFDSFE